MENVLQHLDAFKYVALLIGVIFEGPVFMVVGGFLVKAGFLALIPTYFVLVLGDLVADVVWYTVGRTTGDAFIRKFGKFFSLTPERMEKVKTAFKRHDTNILILSKLTMGFGLAIPVLLTAGISRVPFRKFALINGIGEFFWTAFLISLGYFVGTAYGIVSQSLHVGFLILVLFLIVGAVVGFGNYMREQFLKGKI